MAGFGPGSADWERARLKWCRRMDQNSWRNIGEAIIAGIFMSEGSKIDYRRAMIEIANTDPTYVKASVWYLENTLSVPKSKLRLRLRLHERQDEKICKKYWSELTGIALFNKTQRTTKSRRKTPSKMGVCWVRAYPGQNLLRKHESFLEYHRSMLLKLQTPG